MSRIIKFPAERSFGNLLNRFLRDVERLTCATDVELAIERADQVAALARLPRVKPRLSRFRRDQVRAK